MANPLPRPVIIAASEILSEYYTLERLFSLFRELCPQIIPTGDNAEELCRWWFELVNRIDGLDAHRCLGHLIEEIMERDFQETTSYSGRAWVERTLDQRDHLLLVLNKYSLAYFPGGHVRKIGLASPAQSLEQLLRARDLPAIEAEFRRAITNAEADPPAALTAACSLIEALCKTYLHEKSLPLPKDQSIQDLWKAVQKDLRLDPASKEDEDIKRILGGLSAVVSGIGALRTHAGSAHGRGPTRYTLHPRHARLAIHAAHTLATFVLETWDHDAGQQAATT